MTSSQGSCTLWRVAAVLVLVSTTAHASRLYVKANATGSNNGSNWTNAYVDLQDALTEASSNSSVTEIWVAAGTYKPATCSSCTSTSSEREETFRLVTGVALYGGFAGTESSLSQRTLGCAGGASAGQLCAVNSDCPSSTCSNATVLSGDLNGDDGANWSNYAENSLHVVTYDDPEAIHVIVDGFIIERGNADGNGPDNQGGGVHIREGAEFCLPGGPLLRNCLFQNHSAHHHGAVNDHGLATRIVDCWFRNNRTTDTGAQGGGLQIHMGTKAIVSGCRFSDNDSSGNGGAIWLGCDEEETCGTTTGDCADDETRPRPLIIGCTFVGNAAELGGAVFSTNSNASVHGCDFTGNSASVGGGAIWTEEGSVTLENSAFCDNTAGSTGGGGSYHDDGLIVIASCVYDGNVSEHGGGAYFKDATARVDAGIFSENSATDTYGGGIYVETSAVDVVGCSLDGNFGEFAAGAVYSGAYSHLNVNNSVFTANSAGGFGGGAFSTDGGTQRFANCVFADNGSNALALYNATTTVLNCTFVENTSYGLYHGNNSTTVVNSIFWDNTTASISPSCVSPNCGTCTSSLSVTYSIVEGGYCGTGNSSSDPLFLDPPGDLRLDSNSPGIDSGNNDGLVGGSCTADRDCVGAVESCDDNECVLVADHSGCSRRVDDPSTTDTGSAGGLGSPIVDRGAYEFESSMTNAYDPDNRLEGPCDSDADCVNTGACVQDACYTPKSRYITFAPGSQTGGVAFKVKIVECTLFPAAVGIEKWVGTPDGSGIARLLCNCPPYKTNWPSEILVADADIVPGAVYEVRSIVQGLDTTDPDNYSEPVAVPTSHVWGDAVGESIAVQCDPSTAYWPPPDGRANDDDVDACVEKYQSASTAPPLSWVDVDPAVPNKVVDFTDISRLVDAGNGSPYPFGGPSACADSGPCGACCTCNLLGCSCSQKTDAACSGTWTQGALCAEVECDLGGID